MKAVIEEHVKVIGLSEKHEEKKGDKLDKESEIKKQIYKKNSIISETILPIIQKIPVKEV